MVRRVVNGLVLCGVFYRAVRRKAGLFDCDGRCALVGLCRGSSVPYCEVFGGAVYFRVESLGKV